MIHHLTTIHVKNFFGITTQHKKFLKILKNTKNTDIILDKIHCNKIRGQNGQKKKIN